MARIPCSVKQYYKMVEIAAKHNISVAEVAATLLRDCLEKKYGLRCEHEDIRRSKQGRWYCVGCWRFMKQMRRLRPKKYEGFNYFLPEKTFLEPEEVPDPLVGLQPDQRGGE